MDFIKIFKDLSPSVAAIVALLVVIVYLFRLLHRQIDINAEISAVLAENNKIMEGTKQWIQGLLEAYKSITK